MNRRSLLRRALGSAATIAALPALPLPGSPPTSTVRTTVWWIPVHAARERYGLTADDLNDLLFEQEMRRFIEGRGGAESSAITAKWIAGQPHANGREMHKGGSGR